MGLDLKLFLSVQKHIRFVRYVFQKMAKNFIGVPTSFFLRYSTLVKIMPLAKIDYFPFKDGNIIIEGII